MLIASIHVITVFQITAYMVLCIIAAVLSPVLIYVSLVDIGSKDMGHLAYGGDWKSSTTRVSMEYAYQYSMTNTQLRN